MNKITDSIIEVSKLHYSFNHKEILSDISFSIKEGDFVAVMGRNGAGKTTLIKCLMNLLQPQKGKIFLFKKYLKHFKDWNKISYVPQSYSLDKNFPGAVKEILSLTHPINPDIISYMKIENLLDKKFTELSGGQQQRIMIALSLMSKPELLILDEPTVGIDIMSQQEFYSILKKLNDEKKITVVIVTHDVGVISKYVKSVLCINRNQCCQGAPHQTKDLLKQIYGKDFDLVHHHHEV